MLWNNARIFPFLGSVEALSPDAILRRHTAIREMLKLNELDAALINLDVIKGGARWFFDETGIGPSNDGFALVLPEDTIIQDGPHSQLTPKVERIGSILHLSAEEVYRYHFSKQLSSSSKIGIAMLEHMPDRVISYLLSQLPGIELVDISLAYASVRAERDPWDLCQMMRSALQHDRIIAEAQTAIRAGRTEREIVNDLKINAYRNGGAGFAMFHFSGVALVSAQPGEPVEHNGIRYPGRDIRIGDQISVRVQSIGISGYFGDIGRMFCFGNAGEDAQHNWQTVCEIQSRIAKHAIPGATVSSLEEVFSAGLNEQGITRYKKDFICGVGYSAMEAPNLDFSAIPLVEGMVVSIHPTIFDESDFPYCCSDLYRITSAGAVRMSQTGRELCIL